VQVNIGPEIAVRVLAILLDSRDEKQAARMVLEMQSKRLKVPEGGRSEVVFTTDSARHVKATLYGYRKGKLNPYRIDSYSAQPGGFWGKPQKWHINRASFQVNLTTLPLPELGTSRV
jgi:hypothetical protein